MSAIIGFVLNAFMNGQRSVDVHIFSILFIALIRCTCYT